MNVVLIYIRETKFENNQFKLDFSSREQLANFIEFKKNTPYIIASLNSNVKNANTNTIKVSTVRPKTELDKKAISALSTKSRILLDKGADHFCDIDVLNLVYQPKGLQYDIVDAANNFYFERNSKNLKNYAFKYRFWDETEKKIRNAEIYSPYTQLTAKGLYFTQKGTNIQYVIRLDRELEQIHSYFYSDKIRDLTYQIGYQHFQEINLFFVKDENLPDRFVGKRQQWFSTELSFFIEALCAKTTNQNFNESQFAKKYYNDDKKGQYVIGDFRRRRNLGSRKNLMPIYYLFGQLKIQPNVPFYTSNTIHLKTNTFLKDANIKDLGGVVLSDKDIADIRKYSHPKFSQTSLRKFVCTNTNATHTYRWQDELFFYPQTSYLNFGQPEFDNSRMLARPDKKTIKYREYLNSDREIFKKPYFKNIPSTLTDAELLFDKDVLEIKELVSKTQNVLEEKVYTDIRNYVLYDNENIVSPTFFTEIKKSFSTYGIFSTRDLPKNPSTLIDRQNRIEFSIEENIKKQSLTLQLEDLIRPRTITTIDSKMSNISILKVGEIPKKKIVKTFFVQGIQKFDQFKKLNPLNIEIIDSEIRNEISLYARSNYRYTFRFIVNSLIFSSGLTEDTKAIFIVTNSLLEAPTHFINDTNYNGLGAIYTSEIENWSYIRGSSLWTNVTLTDSALPIAAKHFAFGFESQNFNSLLKFQYSLLNDKGNLIKFQNGETKVPTLNFSIQILA